MNLLVNSYALFSYQRPNIILCSVLSLWLVSPVGLGGSRASLWTECLYMFIMMYFIPHVTEIKNTTTTTTLQHVAWNYLSIPKLQRGNRWNSGMKFHSTLYWACDYSSVLGLNLTYLSKNGPRKLESVSFIYTFSGWNDNIFDISQIRNEHMDYITYHGCRNVLFYLRFDNF